jgi:hypothetical protein
MTKKPKARRTSKSGVTQLALAKHLDISQQRVAQFAAEGIFPRLSDGTLDQGVCRVIYIRWLRDETRKSSTSEAARRVQDARAVEIELRTQRELNKLIEVEEVQAFLSDTIGTLRSELSGIAAASSRDLEVRAAIERNVDAAVARCRASFDAASAALDAGKPINSTDSED